MQNVITANTNESGRNVLLLHDNSFSSPEVESIEEHKAAVRTLSLAELHPYQDEKVQMVKLALADLKTNLDKETSLLAYILEKVLVPNGLLVITWKNGSQEEKSNLEKQLFFSGYVSIKSELNNVTAKKSEFEVGEAVKLSLQGTLSGPKQAWKVSANDDDDLIDDEALLDEDDLKKPDPASLKVCGTTGKRKACKDCSCGLAEELANEDVKHQNPPAKSSCGSCYLGDAFRCATCPYLGMPAFKPGQKVKLSDAMMEPDA